MHKVRLSAGWTRCVRAYGAVELARQRTTRCAVGSPRPSIPAFAGTSWPTTCACLVRSNVARRARSIRGHHAVRVPVGRIVSTCSKTDGKFVAAASTSTPNTRRAVARAARERRSHAAVPHSRLRGCATVAMRGHRTRQPECTVLSLWVDGPHCTGGRDWVAGGLPPELTKIANERRERLGRAPRP